MYDDNFFVRLNDLRRYKLVDRIESISMPPSTLLCDLSSYVNNQMLSDVTFIVEDKQIFAHKILCVRYKFFHQLMMGLFEEARYVLILKIY